jgi:amino acid transporter
MGFSKLVALDVMLYGLSLLLEFVALVALRIREPKLERPFKVWGGLVGAVLVGVAPMALIGIALMRNRNESIAGMNVLVFGALLIAAGPLIYGLGKMVKRSRSKAE